MIPKIIHFTWFNNEPYPIKIPQCMDSWYNLLSDFQFVHWSIDSFKDLKNPFLQEALEMKK